MRYEDRFDDYARTLPRLTGPQVAKVTTDQTQALRRETTYPQITADQNNFPLTDATLHRFETDAARNITGFANPSDGLKVIRNFGAQNLILVQNSGSSLAANRIVCPNAASITLTGGANESCLITYDFASSRWVVVGFA